MVYNLKSWKNTNLKTKVLSVCSKCYSNSFFFAKNSIFISIMESLCFNIVFINNKLTSFGKYKEPCMTFRSFTNWRLTLYFKELNMRKMSHNSNVKNSTSATQEIFVFMYFKNIEPSAVFYVSRSICNWIM